MTTGYSFMYQPHREANLAREWSGKRGTKQKEITRGQKVTRLEHDIFPWPGDKDLNDIEC